jgi:hypothetical protein
MSSSRHHTLRRTSGIVPAAVLALVLAAAGCGGSDSSSDGDAVSFSSWKKQVNSLCATARKDVDEIDTPEDTTDFAGWQSGGIAVKKRVNTFIDQVDKVGTPSTQSAKAKAFTDQWRAYTADFDGLVAAAKQEDADKVEAALTKLQEANDKKDELAKGLGLDECYRDDSDDSAADDTSDTTGDTLSKNPTSTTTTPADDTADESAGGSTADRLPPSEWSAEINAACTALSEKYTSLSNADPKTVEEAQAVAKDLSAFASDLVSEWNRIGPPAGDTAKAQQLYDLFVQFEGIATRFQDAVTAADTASIESITTELDQVTGQMAPLATELGVPACGSA